MQGTTILNERPVTITVKRIELCDLLLACTNTAHHMRQKGGNPEKWNALHDALKAALLEFDKAQEN